MITTTFAHSVVHARADVDTRVRRAPLGWYSLLIDSMAPYGVLGSAARHGAPTRGCASRLHQWPAVAGRGAHPNRPVPPEALRVTEPARCCGALRVAPTSRPAAGAACDPSCIGGRRQAPHTPFSPSDDIVRTMLEHATADLRHWAAAQAKTGAPSMRSSR